LALGFTFGRFTFAALGLLTFTLGRFIPEPDFFALAPQFLPALGIGSSSGSGCLWR
jgi:hypothetical protein